MVVALAYHKITGCHMPHSWSFEALCVPLEKSLHAKAMQLTRNHANARDLVQETMLRGLAAWATFRVLENEKAEDRASAWMHRILMNQFITGHRRATFRHEILEQHSTEYCELVMGEMPAAPNEQSISASMARALEELDPSARDVLLRVDVRGETYREIQDELGISIGTVKSRLHRARKRLADALVRRGMPPPMRLDS